MSSFVSRYGPWAVVAGASQGLGAAFSRALAARGVNVLLIARREPPLAALADELRARHAARVRTASVDLGDPGLAARLDEISSGLDVGLLVYNACHSIVAEFLALSVEDKQKMVDVNCRGPLVASSWVAPRLVERGRGGIVLMSSLSGFQGTAMVGTYAATKAFDTVLGEALWEELGRHGVDVLVCAAGATSTPNFETQTPAAMRGKAFPMQPADVADGALDRLGKVGPTWIPGRVNRWVQRALRVVPRGRAVRFISNSTRRIYEGRRP